MLKSELHTKFKERRLNPRKILIEEQMAFGKLAGQSQQLSVHRRHNNPKGVSNLIEMFGKSIRNTSNGVSSSKSF